MEGERKGGEERTGEERVRESKKNCLYNNQKVHPLSTSK